eukprot:2942714-Pyramimonas_sp.AAC.1
MCPGPRGIESRDRVVHRENSEPTCPSKKPARNATRFCAWLFFSFDLCPSPRGIESRDRAALECATGAAQSVPGAQLGD